MKCCIHCGSEMIPSEDNPSVCPKCTASPRGRRGGHPAFPDTCPECGDALTPGMPGCINGHSLPIASSPSSDTRGISPLQQLIDDLDAPDPVQDQIPWLCINGIEVRCRSGDVIGRAGTVRPDLFAPYGMVSGSHCALFLNQGQWIIQRLHSGRNMTSLDGVLIEAGGSVSLTGTHVLQMSSQCTVRISLKPSAPR